VIEEIPGEKEQGPTKEQAHPRDTQEIITWKEVKDIPKLREETIKVGKFDLRGVEKEVEESRKTGTLITHNERVDHSCGFVTDQHTVSETKIDVIDERVRMGLRPKDKTFMGVQKTVGPRVITDRIDGGQKVDDKTGEKKIVESTIGTISNYTRQNTGQQFS
jgi:hypothetical protein